MSKSTKLWILIAALAVALAGLVALRVSLSQPAEPHVFVVTGPDTFVQVTGTLEPPSRGVGVLVDTPEPPSGDVGVLTDCTGIGDADDFGAALLKWDPFDMEDIQTITGCGIPSDIKTVKCQYWSGGFGFVGTGGSATNLGQTAVKIVPSSGFMLENLKVYLVIDGESNRPSGNITATIKTGISPITATTVALSAVAISGIPLDADDGNYYRSYAYTTFTYTPNVFLASGEPYWVVFSIAPPGATWKYVGVASSNYDDYGTDYDFEPFPFGTYDCRPYDDAPAWYPDYDYRITNSQSTPTVGSFGQQQIPIALNGTVPTATPTPVSLDAYFTEILSVQGSTPTPRPTRTPTPAP